MTLLNNALSQWRSETRLSQLWALAERWSMRGYKRRALKHWRAATAMEVVRREVGEEATRHYRLKVCMCICVCGTPHPRVLCCVTLANLL